MEEEIKKLTCETSPGIGLIACNILKWIEDVKTPAEKMDSLMSFAALCSVCRDRIKIDDESTSELLEILNDAEKLAQQVIDERS